ncbi:MAG: hypothetical protein L6Q33_03690 [Bacteriovoracaceae bacterium]|nr:hypothetical protein [Bacteriovoracaceae bacterium]
MASFCFQNQLESNRAKKEISDLLLPTDKIIERDNSPCFDIVTSRADRVELFENFLKRRFEIDFSRAKGSNLRNEENCRIDFITTRKSDKKVTVIKAGQMTKAFKEDIKTDQVTTQSLQLQPGMPGKIGYDTEFLELLCQPQAGDQFLMTISHLSMSGSVKTTIRLGKGMKFNIADSVNDINNQKRQLGYPQSEWIKTVGNELVTYELVVQ